MNLSGNALFVFYKQKFDHPLQIESAWKNPSEPRLKKIRNKYKIRMEGTLRGHLVYSFCPKAESAIPKPFLTDLRLTCFLKPSVTEIPYLPQAICLNA